MAARGDAAAGGVLSRWMRRLGATPRTSARRRRADRRRLAARPGLRSDRGQRRTCCGTGSEPARVRRRAAFQAVAASADGAASALHAPARRLGGAAAERRASPPSLEAPGRRLRAVGRRRARAYAGSPKSSPRSPRSSAPRGRKGARTSKSCSTSSACRPGPPSRRRVASSQARSRSRARSARPDLAGYRQLIRSLLALGAREGVRLSWWSPWNEPNDPHVPQSAASVLRSDDSPSLAPAVYAQLARRWRPSSPPTAAFTICCSASSTRFATDSRHRTSVASFVAALPASVVCLSDVWSIHAYASYGARAAAHDPVEALERALDARGGCGAGRTSGSPRPAPARRTPGTSRSQARRRSTKAALRSPSSSRLVADARVGAVFQYSFREDPAFPVGLLSADLAHLYPAYDLWLSYARARARGRKAPAPAALCA